MESIHSRKREYPNDEQPNDSTKKRKTIPVDRREISLEIPEIHRCIMCEDFDLLENMIKIVGVDVNAQDKLGNTALIFAAVVGNVKICELLLDNGAYINAKNNNGLTSINMAICRMKNNIVELLINRECDIYAPSIYGITSFHLATKYNNMHALKLLVKENERQKKLPIGKLLDVLMYVPFYYTLYSSAANRDNFIKKIMRNPQKYGNIICDGINVRDVFGSTVLLSWISYHTNKTLDVPIVSLINHCADVIDFFIVDNKKQNIMHYASAINNSVMSIGIITTIINNLRQKNVSDNKIYELVNQMDLYGMTPLFISKINDNKLITDTLINIGAKDIPDLKQFYDLNRINCPICLNMCISPRAIACGHLFCRSCLYQWKSKSKKCPVCRKNIYLEKSETLFDIVIKLTIEKLSNNKSGEVLMDRTYYVEKFLENIEKLSEYIGIDLNVDDDNVFRVNMNETYSVSFSVLNESDYFVIATHIIDITTIDTAKKILIYEYLLTKLSTPNPIMFFDTGNYLKGGFIRVTLDKFKISIYFVNPLDKLNDSQFFINAFKELRELSDYHIDNLMQLIDNRWKAHNKIPIENTNQVNSYLNKNLNDNTAQVEIHFKNLQNIASPIIIINNVYIFSITVGSNIHKILLRYNNILHKYMIIVVLQKYNEENKSHFEKILIHKFKWYHLTIDIGMVYIMEIDQQKYYCYNTTANQNNFTCEEHIKFFLQVLSTRVIDLNTVLK